MREIKFRAWSKKTKEMTYFEFYDVIIDPAIYLNIKDVVLMQYIGLKDKKGRQVYEGDLLKNDNEKYLWEVKWNKKMAWFEVLYTAHYPSRESGNILEIKKNEIIGNIYENPELIK